MSLITLRIENKDGYVPLLKGNIFFRALQIKEDIAKQAVSGLSGAVCHKSSNSVGSSLGVSAVGLGLANEVYVLLCLHTADPSSAVRPSHCLYNFVQAKQHHVEQGHTEPLNDYFNHQVDAIWRGLHQGRRTTVFPNPEIFRELACGSQGAAWRDSQAKAAQLQHFLSVATKIMTLSPARPQGPHVPSPQRSPGHRTFL